jgi:hypothetical protein
MLKTIRRIALGAALLTALGAFMPVAAARADDDDQNSNQDYTAYSQEQTEQENQQNYTAYWQDIQQDQQADPPQN